MSSVLRYVVPDTCALAASLYNELLSLHAAPLVAAICTRQVEAVAPSLGRAEFLNVSRKKLVAPSPLLPADVDAVVSDFLSLPILWVEIDTLTAPAWLLHRTHGLQTADAFFVEVAREWQAELWTTDEPFYNAALAVHPATFNLRVTPFA